MWPVSGLFLLYFLSQRVDGLSGGEGRRRIGIKRDGRTKMPEAELTEETGLVFSFRDDVTS